MSIIRNLLNLGGFLSKPTKKKVLNTGCHRCSMGLPCNPDRCDAECSGEKCRARRQMQFTVKQGQFVKPAMGADDMDYQKLRDMSNDKGIPIPVSGYGNTKQLVESFDTPWRGQLPPMFTSTKRSMHLDDGEGEKLCIAYTQDAYSKDCI